MSEHDPLRQKRLGLRALLLVSGGVLAASSAFILPSIGGFEGSASTTDLVRPGVLPPPTSSGPPATGNQSRGAATGSTDGAQPLLPIYWVGEVGGTERLFREFVVSPGGTSDNPISEAVRIMTEGHPLDPDYFSPWSAASSVSSSVSTRNVITLDISSDALAQRLDEEDAVLALQQLVYTATAAAANGGLTVGGETSSVVVLVDGAAGHRAFGSVDLDGELTRDASAPAPVWIVDPQEGVEGAPGNLVIHGLGPVGNEPVTWRIERRLDRRTDGSTEGGTELFRDGSADIVPTDAGLGAYSFAVDLPAGRYDITVAAGPGGDAARDSKSVVVR